MNKMLIVLFLGVLTVAMAHGSVIANFNGMTNLGGGQFAYSYDVCLSPDQRMQLYALTGEPGHWNFAIDNHFTFVDFSGYVNGSASCSQSIYCPVFSLDTQNSAGFSIAQSVLDSATIPNVSWKFYTDAITIPAGTYLGRFTMVSIVGTQGVIAFTGQATQEGGFRDGGVVGNTIMVVGPAAVPEPATMLLLGAGLVAWVAYRSGDRLKRRVQE